nr:hypothetical protein Iba_chr04bCG13990 [Ipomoea batatas]
MATSEIRVSNRNKQHSSELYSLSAKCRLTLSLTRSNSAILTSTSGILKPSFGTPSACNEQDTLKTLPAAELRRCSGAAVRQCDFDRRPSSRGGAAVKDRDSAAAYFAAAVRRTALRLRLCASRLLCGVGGRRRSAKDWGRRLLGATAVGGDDCWGNFSFGLGIEFPQQESSTTYGFYCQRLNPIQAKMTPSDPYANRQVS